MKGKLLVLSLIAAMLIGGLMLATAGTTDLNGVTIAENDDRAIMLLFGTQGDDVDVVVSAVDGTSTFDVYIMTSAEYGFSGGLAYPQSFNPVVAHEDVSTIDFSWTQPDDQTYYIVVDNHNNSRADNAIPTGPITVDISYTDTFGEALEGVAQTCGIILIVILVVFVLIVVGIILLIVYFVRRSGKKKREGHGKKRSKGGQPSRPRPEGAAPTRPEGAAPAQPEAAAPDQPESTQPATESEELPESEG